MTPEVGLELVDPRAGTRIVFTATAASTDGKCLQVEATYPPGSRKPPPHHHPRQREHFLVQAGAMTVVRADETFTASLGDEFVVEPGVTHHMWNAGDDPARVQWTVTPPLRTGEMFCGLWQVAHDNEWRPTPLQVWEVVSRFPDEFVLDA